MTLNVADANLTLRNEEKEWSEHVPSVYRQFSKHSHRNRNADILIWPRFGGLPILKSSERMFVYSTEWDVFKTSTTRCIRLLTPDSLHARLLVHLNSDFTKGTSYIDEQFISKAVPGNIYENAFYAINRILLMHFLAQRRSGIFHAGLMNLGGRGYIFPGKSGTGKSTLIQHFARRNCGKVIGEDRIIIRTIGDRFMAYGTP